MTRASGLAVLAPGTADTCPVCQRDHEQLDQFWACPKHGHKLTKIRDDGDFEVYGCPARTPRPCPYERRAPRKPRSPSKGDPMTAIATRPSVAVDTMWARQRHIAGILPAHVEVKSFLGTAMAALYADPKLMKAAENAPESLVGALMECASLGHRPGTEEYYLTPRGGKILGIEGYRGIVERMYRSGAVAAVIVREVCAKDEFRFTEGEDEVPIHKIAGQAGGGTTGAAFFGDGGQDRGEMVGVYAYARLTTGGVSRVVLLSRADVLAARDSGDNDDPRYSPWHRLDGGKDHPEFTGRSMWWKTAVKRLEPWVPTSAEYRNAEARAAAQAAPHRSAGNGQQALPGTPRPDPAACEAIGQQIAMEFGRLGIVDEEERAVLVARLTGTQPGDVLPEAELMKALRKLEGCEDTAELHEPAQAS